MSLPALLLLLAAASLLLAATPREFTREELKAIEAIEMAFESNKGEVKNAGDEKEQDKQGDFFLLWRHVSRTLPPERDTRILDPSKGY